MRNEPIKNLFELKNYKGVNIQAEFLTFYQSYFGSNHLQISVKQEQIGKCLDSFLFLQKHELNIAKNPFAKNKWKAI